MSGASPIRVPGATYRLQFNRGFTFQQASDICGYLHDLGITDCYASPLFRASPASTHGYDICDFNELNPELGGTEEFNRFYQSRNSAGLGLLLDMVPNHMGNDLSNLQWSDVLENGRSSKYAPWFDINWSPMRADLTNKVLLPVLEDHYGKVLEAGKLRLSIRPDKGGLAVAYYDRLFPLSPETTARVLEMAVALPLAQAGTWTDQVREVAGQFTSASAQTPIDLHEPRTGLARVLSESEPARNALEQTLANLNGRPGDASSFGTLDGILQKQHYRLAYWKVGPEEINYRRFFEVTELASLRIESPEVVAATHELLFRLVREGRVTGLRIDHPDGLRDPRTYFQRLQAAAPSYVVVEKILTGDEPLPNDWPVQGTTGYDFLNRVNGVFIDQSSCSKLDYFYREFTRCPEDFASVAYQGKRWMLTHSLISELNALTCTLVRISAQTRRGYDFSQRALKAALVAVIAAFPVYRTYINDQTDAPSQTEQDYIQAAIALARSRNNRLDGEVLDFIDELLLLKFPRDDSPLHPDCRDFVMRFQQLSGPVMAKGLEDTAFYRFNRLVSLNEVGGDPSEFGYSVDQFHTHNQQHANRWPHSLLASATHDTKRGEDVRARINVISEMPDRWREAVSAWSAINARHKTNLEIGPAPDANDEYLFYQILAGCWMEEQRGQDDPESLASRLSAYMLKALKESKRYTTWTDPNPAYEEATTRFVQAVLSTDSKQFLHDFSAVQRQIAYFGVFNSLGQTLLKLTSPGVPDIYQGAELWDFNLVDPDNRRQVDYNLRRELLQKLANDFSAADDLRPLLQKLLEHTENAQVKLYTIWRALQLRNARRDLFDNGEYIPMSATGDCREHVIAFARRSAGSSILVVVPRLTLKLTAARERPPLGPDVWRGTRILVEDPVRFRNVLTNDILTVSDPRNGLLLGEALSSFPVALLASE